MKFLFRNILISSLVCFVIDLIIFHFGKYLLDLVYGQNMANDEFYLKIYLTMTLLYTFVFWPLVQAIIMAKLYGFKSVLSKIISFILLFCSIQIGWLVFFAILKGPNMVTLLQQSALYLIILAIQIFLFFVFVMSSKK